MSFDGLSFSGTLPPPNVPPDPSGNDWRGLPGTDGADGAPGPPGPMGPPGAATGTVIATGSTTARTLPDRFADWVNVKDFGAVLNGTTSDTVAFRAAINAVADRGTIFVPPGGINVPALTEATSTKRILWQMSGNTFGTGTTAVSGLGNGVVESFLANSTKFFSRASSIGQAGIGPAVRVDMVLNHDGGTVGGIEALQVNASTTATSAPDTYPFALTATLTMRSSQSSGPPGTCFSAVAQRMAGAGPASAFAMNPQATDFTGLPSGTGGSLVTAEFNLKANKLDDGTLADGRTQNGSVAIPGANRSMLDLKYLRTDRDDNTPMECGTALNIGLSTELDLPYCSLKNAIRINHNVTWAAINLHPAIFQGNANAILMPKDARVAWSPDDPNAGVVPTNFRYLQYTATGTPRLRYMVGATERLTLPDAKPVVSGAKGGNAALASLLAALVAANLVTDSTTA